MIDAIELLRSRGFCAISIMIDPTGNSDDCYLNTTHKNFTNELRFFARLDNISKLKEMISTIVNIYDNKIGRVWRIPSNKRIALNILPYNHLLIQGTESGIRIAEGELKLDIYDANEIKSVKRVNQ